MAGRPCEACRHPERAAIDAAILARTPFRSIASRYEMSDVSLIRHRSNHMGAQFAAAAEARAAELEPVAQTAPAEPSRREQTAEALDVIGQLRAVNAVVLQVLSDARKAGDKRLVLLAVDRVMKQLELQAKLIGAIDERPSINVLVAPEWLLVRSTLLETLRPYPEARTAVAGALMCLETA